MSNKIRIFLAYISLILTITSFQNCTNKKNKPLKEENADSSDLVIFHSNGLNFQVGELIKEFNKIYPDIKVTSEAGNAIENLKKMTEQNRKCDIFMLTDNNQLDKLLIPEFADWSIPFAGNEMVVGYTDKSKKSNQINSDNWYKILLEKDIKYGRADKETDPVGGKTFLMIKLAQQYYKQNELLRKFSLKDTHFVVSKSAELLTLIDSGKVDYILTYKSVAVLHKLKYITLPDEINFKSMDHIFDYGKATMERKGKKPGQSRGVMGAPILYGMTVLRSAPHPTNAMLFTEYLLDPKKGLTVFEKSGNNVLSPIPVRNYERIPENLKKYTKPFDMKGKKPFTEKMAPGIKPDK